MTGDDVEDLLAINTKYQEFKKKYQTDINILSSFDKQPLVDQFKRQFEHSLQDEHSHSMILNGTLNLSKTYKYGTYLACELGGSTLRISIMALKSSTDYETVHFYDLNLTPEHKQLSHRDFFMFIIDCIVREFQESKLEINSIKMGLIWSFPLRQTNFDEGILLPMGKGFKFSKQIEGMDLITLFNSFFQERKLDIELKCLLNDTIAIILEYKYLSRNETMIGLVLGTGVNCSLSLKEGINEKLYNSELSLFGGFLPKTRWDVQLNDAHDIPDFQPLELLVGGRYLGEQLRLILLDLLEDGLIERTAEFEQLLSKSYHIDTKFCSDIERILGEQEDSKEVISLVSELIQSNYNVVLTDEDIVVLTGIIRLLSCRVKNVLSIVFIALHELLKEYNKQEVLHVGCCGSVISNYYKLKEDIKTLANGDINLQFQNFKVNGLLGCCVACSLL